VVRIDGGTAWLEPEQTTSCGHCASSASCGAGAHVQAGQGDGNGIGSLGSRLQARRFAMDAPVGSAALRIGDRVVVGVGEGALLRGALTAYGLPLLTALLGGALAETGHGQDTVTIVGMLAGLTAGLLAARLLARRMTARGDLAPHFVRLAQPDESCGTSQDPLKTVRN
jgi:sigma-E factor negative regulatory protein RseC